MSGKTVEALIRTAAHRLQAAGIENGFADAKWLLTYAQQREDRSLVEVSDQRVTDLDEAQFEKLIARRLQREPLQHILGETGFYTINVKSDARALVPRPDSETLIDLALELLPSDQATKIADLGTGSGALLAAVLTERPNCSGIAVEASAEALSLATENFESLGLSDRTQVFRGSWSDWAGWADCDLIISNPPYIRSDVIPTLAPEVREYDPLFALDGGVDGLEAYREIAGLASARMKLNSHIILEIGFDQLSDVSELLRHAGLTIIEARQDLAGQDRAIAAQKR